MNQVVLVIGEGFLAEYVCRQLENSYQLIHKRQVEGEWKESVNLALVLHDAWYPLEYHKAELLFQATGTSWLRGFVTFGEGVVGPLVQPGLPGCSKCADVRRIMADRDRKMLWELQQRKLSMSIDSDQSDTWASRTGLIQIAQLLIAEVHRVLQGDSELQLKNHMHIVHLRTLNSSRHSFLPDPHCSICGHLPLDSPDGARILLKPSRKVKADSFRCRTLEELNRVLVPSYLDYRTGCLNGKMQDLVSPFASVSVNLPLMMGNEGAAGRTHSFEESELTAILEGLERYCGLSPRGKKTGVFDSYHHLKDHALNPLEVGLHAKKQYAKREFPFQAFHPDRPMSWVWGYSMIRESPILVPELLAYYSLGCGDGFVYETSNGCAIGGSLEEAIFYGILEVVERDSFLLTWYAQLPLQPIDLQSAQDQELQLMIQRLQAVAGYDLHVFNSTMEHGIPSVWAIAKNNRTVRKEGVNLICAAGAHVDPIRAVKSAVHELAGMMLTLDEKFEEQKEMCMQMLHNSSLVQHMEDHSMLYSLPEAEERLHFLLDPNRPSRTFEQAFTWKRTTNQDLTEDLKTILDAFRQVKLDVIVVDQTTPELTRNGLHCVKVLIPGMLPMTFGHHLTRLEGLERVLHVPMKLGYKEHPLTPEQLNPHPHPFP